MPGTPPSETTSAAQAVARWLAAERREGEARGAGGREPGAGDGAGSAADLEADFALEAVAEAEAEAALRAMLRRSLASAAPPGGFADRVMARVAADAAAHSAPAPALAARDMPPREAAGAAAVTSRRLRPWLQAAGALGGLAALLALLAAPRWVPGFLGAVFGAGRIGGALQAAVSAVTVAGQGLAAAASLFNTLFLLIQAVAKPLATPLVGALTCILLLLAALALRCLHDLIQRDRRWVYADPI